MLKKKLGAMVLAGLLVTGVTWASHSKADDANEAAIQKTLQANYDKMAAKSKDPGEWKGDVEVKQINSSFDTIDALKVEGDRATVDAIYAFSMAIADSKGQPHEIVFLNKKHDVWLKVGPQWILNNSKIVWESGTRDGQKYEMKTRAVD